jgi:hypothetical protein
MYDEGTSEPSPPDKTLHERGKTMITFVRSVGVAAGKTGEAIAYAHHIAKLVTEKTGVAVEVNLPVGGNPSRIAWVAHYDGLAQWEAMSAQLLADKDYMAALTNTGAIFVSGSMQDEFWRRI